METMSGNSEDGRSAVLARALRDVLDAGYSDCSFHKDSAMNSSKSTKKTVMQFSS